MHWAKYIIKWWKSLHNSLADKEKWLNIGNYSSEYIHALTRTFIENTVEVHEIYTWCTVGGAHILFTYIICVKKNKKKIKAAFFSSRKRNFKTL